MDVRDHSRLESIMESVQDVSVDTNETSIGTVEQYQMREERLSKSYDTVVPDVRVTFSTFSNHYA